MKNTHIYLSAIFAPLFAFLLFGAMTDPALAQKEDKKVTKSKAKAIPPFKNTKPYTKATKGAWKVECFKTQFEAREGKPAKEFENCVIFQDAVSPKEKRLKIRMTFLQETRQGKDGKVQTREAIDIATPLGVFLPVGLAVEVDGKAEGRFPYIMCRPNVCLTRMDLNEKRKQKILKAKKLKLLVYLAPGRGFPITIKMGSLKDALSVRDKTHAANRKQ